MYISDSGFFDCVGSTERHRSWQQRIEHIFDSLLANKCSYAIMAI